MNNLLTLIFILIIVVFAVSYIFLFYQKNKLNKKNNNLSLSLSRYRNEFEKLISSKEKNLQKEVKFIGHQNSVQKFAEFTILSLDFEEIIQEATVIIADALDVEFTQILELSSNGSVFLLKAGVGWKKEFIGFATIQAVDNEASYTVKMQQPVIMEDLFIENRFKVSPLLHNHKIMSGATIPIKIKDKIYGVLGTYTTSQRLFLPDEISFIQQIVDIISLAGERYQQQEKLYLLERAIDSSTNGIIITDASQADNPVIYTNSGFEKITGYSKREILGHNCNFLQRDDRQQPQIKEIRKAILEGKEIQTVLRNYRKDGSLFWNELIISPVHNYEGFLTHFVGIQKDISEQIYTELALKEKTTTLEKFTESLTLLNKISVKNFPNIEDIFSQYLETGCQILGMQTGIISEVMGDIYIIQNSFSAQFDLLLPGTQYNLKNTFCSKVIEDKKTISYHEISQNKFLSKHPIYLNFQPECYLGTPIWINGEIYGTLSFYSKNCQKVFLNHEYELIELMAQAIGKAISLDETELQRKQMEIALGESQERLDSILTSLEDVIWSIHLETFQLLYINPAAEKIYECNLSYFFHQKCAWLELIHPQDKTWVKESYNNLLKISLLSDFNNNYQDLEYRILLNNGQEKYLRDRAHIVYDLDGKPIRADGIITDITNRKRTQIELQKSEEQFRLTFELAPIGMLIINLEGYIEQVNSALCEFLKYEPKELIGNNYASLIHPDDLNFDFVLKQKILNREINEYEREQRYLTKNNKIVYTILKVTVLKDYQGKPTQFIKQIVDISERKKAEEQILYDALHDKLTGLANRVLFIELLSQTLSRCQRNQIELCAVLFLDLDDFKRANESLGHKFGDQLLIIMSEKIKSCLHLNDTLARLGGDEFAIILDNLKSEKEATDIAEKILNSCNIPLEIEGYEFFTSVSIGIAFSSIGYTKAEDMLRDADLTMYEAKNQGRNCYSIFDQNMYSQLLKRVQLESLLRKAIEDEEFILYYQPIVSLKTRKLVGFEALIRWQNKSLGFVSPNNFIPVTEETGLIIPLGEWIFLQAAKQASIWEKMFPNQTLVISVNLSGKQLIEPNLLKKIDEILELTQVNAELLKVEVTETILIDNFKYVSSVLKELQKRDLKISLDDFGTGFSSLSYLHLLPLNTLKIDRSFITPIEKHPEKSAIVKAIVSLAHNLSLDVIAEGIETEKQVEVLTKINCDYAQGYLFSKPLNVKDAELLIKENYFPILKTN